MAHKVWECKNRWYQEKANSIQCALSLGRPSVVWQDVHAICRSRAGLQSVQPRAVRKQDGSLCCGSEETLSDGETILRVFLTLRASSMWPLLVVLNK